MSRRGEDPAADDAPSPGARIGPNAVTRLDEALVELQGGGAADRVFLAAGQIRFRREPPAAMVDERAVTALHAALRRELAPADAGRVARRAGTLTGDYLLAHRIPAPVRALLGLLPASASARLLVRAMARHAWTFAGSGQFSASFPGASAAARRAGEPRLRLQLVVAACPLCRGASTPRPACDYYAATFERLFRALVSPAARVDESACRACGARDCTFDVLW